MKILIAEDDPISRYMLETTLKKWSYDVRVSCDGQQAWERLQAEEDIQLVILDWMMPGFDGVQLCQKARESMSLRSLYIILLTAKSDKGDIVTGLEAGADDYLTKPFDREELRARLQVGARVIELQNKIAQEMEKLQRALSQIKQLQGILPICSHCKKVRDDQNYWRQVESYICAHSDLQFSHSVCPDCYDTIVLPQIERFMARENAAS